ncbi:MAG: decarboxylase, partial [Clostridiales Family XIII bacterium]|nr:decarboxylase [Clostridiales Family XIII bacterium]
MDQKRTPLFDAIKDFACRDVVPMFIPSHKMGRAIHPEWKEFAGENIFKMDLCEIHGLDDLHQPKDVIKESQELAADAWGADRSFFLVNGTSSGIIASICSVVSEGQQIIVPRNAHKSVVFGLIVSGAEPVYVSADIYKEKGLVGGFRPAELDRIYAQNPGAKGVFGVSPTYHGICSDMKGLIDVTHRGGGIFIA